jgi:hypothetical protein
MKSWKMIFIPLVLLLLPAYSYSTTLGDLRVSFLEGDVQVKTEDTSDWVPAAINMPLRAGDRLWVPDGGRAELNLRDGTYVRLDQGSALDILATEGDAFQFYLSTGHAYVNYRGQRSRVLQLDTPASSVRAYDRSRFRIDVSSDGYTQVSVLTGSVYAESRNGKTRVSSGKTLSLRDDTYADLSPLGPSDEWEQWNGERDRRLSERRYSSQYLPDELSGYSNDFDEYGRWTNTRDYGYVWSPTVVVSAGWAPYRTGRWVWIGGDYVWISYEPWGWAPYHYGRWSFLASIGWCWVPPLRGDVYWGPGYVGWVSTPTYVSWVPLAPGEMYYGYGNYGRNSVNIVNVNVTNITTVYKNVYVNNGITTISRDTFLTGRPVPVRVTENPFIGKPLPPGRPLISPVRETRVPMIKDIPGTKLPPQPLRDIQVKNLMQNRPLVREQNRSVMKPGSVPKDMPIRGITAPGSSRGGEVQRPGKAPAAPAAPGRGPTVPGGEVQRPGKAPAAPGGEVKKPVAPQKQGTAPETEQPREPGTRR